MTSQQAQRNVWLYFIFQIGIFHLFWGPILILYINQVAGMSLTEIYLMESLCIAGLMILEVPSGALADLIGRRKVIIIGSWLMLVETFFFAFAWCPLMIWTGNILWVLGYSLISGADEALFIDSLKVLKQDHNRRALLGKINYYRYLVTAVTSLIAGSLAEIDLRLPMRLDIITQLAVCLTAYCLVEPPLKQQAGYNLKQHQLKIYHGIKQVVSSSSLIWLICFSVLLSIVSKIWFFSYNPYFELVGLDLVNFGLIFCVLNLVAAIFGRLSDRLSKLLGDLGSITLLLSCLAFPLLIMGSWANRATAGLVIVQNVVRGYQAPFVKHIFHDYVESDHRATVSSMLSACRGFGEWLALAGYGLLLTSWSLTGCLQLLGWLTLLAGCLLIASYWRIFR